MWILHAYFCGEGRITVFSSSALPGYFHEPPETCTTGKKLAKEICIDERVPLLSEPPKLKLREGIAICLRNHEGET